MSTSSYFSKSRCDFLKATSDADRFARRAARAKNQIVRDYYVNQAALVSNISRDHRALRSFAEKMENSADVGDTCECQLLLSVHQHFATAGPIDSGELPKKVRMLIKLSFVANCVLALIKGVAYYLSLSWVILSSMLDSCLDLVSDIISWLGHQSSCPVEEFRMTLV